MEHEEWGERTQIVLLLLGAIELVGLALRKSPKARLVHALAGVVGLVGVFFVYETGEHGGELVYAYAGGVGIRSGEPKDVEARHCTNGVLPAMLADRFGRLSLGTAKPG